MENKITFGLLFNHILACAKERYDIISFRKADALMFVVDGLALATIGKRVVDVNYFAMNGVPCSEPVYYMSKSGSRLSSLAEPVLFSANHGKSARVQLRLNTDSELGKMLSDLTNIVIESLGSLSDVDLCEYVSLIVSSFEEANESMKDGGYSGPIAQNKIRFDECDVLFGELLDYLKDIRKDGGDATGNVVAFQR